MNNITYLINNHMLKHDIELVQFRLDQIVAFYGKDETYQVFTTGSCDSMTVFDRTFLSNHLSNLVRTYGAGSVNSVFRIMFDAELKPVKRSNKSAVKRKVKKGSSDVA